MNTNDRQLNLKKIKDDYFNQQISAEHYRAARTKLLDEMEVQINGRHNANPNSAAQLNSTPGEDENPFA